MVNTLKSLLSILLILVLPSAALSATVHSRTNKATPTTSDEIPIEDAAASWGSKKTTLGALPISSATQTALNAKENSLGNPGTSGWCLQSTDAGVRSWGVCGSGSFDQAGNYTLTGSWNFSGATVTGLSGGSMVYPGAGVPNSTGIAWGTSYTVGTGANNLVKLNGSSQLPAVSAALLTNFPTLNQNTTGTAAGLSAQYIDWNASSGGSSIANKPTIPNLASPGTIGGTTPGAAIFTTIGAGAGGFSVDADGDVIGKTFTTPRGASPSAVEFKNAVTEADYKLTLTLSAPLTGDVTKYIDQIITTSSFDDTPDNGSTTTAPTANWAYNHAADTAIHNIAAGASPTVDASGEMSVDTTSDQFIYYGGAKRVLTYKKQENFAIKSPVDADDVLWFKAQTAITVTDIHVIAQGGGSISVNIQECDSAGANCATLDAAITADSDGAEDDGSLSNGSIDAGDWVKIVLGAPSGTVNFLTGSIYYVETAD